MGNRANRKKTRDSKEVAIRAEIRVGLAGGEQFGEIARIVSGRYPVGFGEALRMIAEEWNESAKRHSKRDNQKAELR